MKDINPLDELALTLCILDIVNSFKIDDEENMKCILEQICAQTTETYEELIKTLKEDE